MSAPESRPHVDTREVEPVCARRARTFAEFNVFAQVSCVRIPGDVPLDVACLV
jgi:hypothetical protein